MSDYIPSFRITHLGINNPDAATASDVTEQLCRIFGLIPRDETATHIFAGDLFEVKKNLTKGTYGHVALQTDDIEKALDYLAEKGVGIVERSIRRTEDGRISFVYLDLEIAGFAFHLTL